MGGRSTLRRWGRGIPAVEIEDGFAPLLALVGSRVWLKQASEQYLCLMCRGENVSPHPAQSRSRGRFLPQCVSSVAAQFGHTIRRLSMR